jgi:hypothetical protein
MMMVERNERGKKKRMTCVIYIVSSVTDAATMMSVVWWIRGTKLGNRAVKRKFKTKKKGEVVIHSSRDAGRILPALKRTRRPDDQESASEAHPWIMHGSYSSCCPRSVARDIRLLHTD